MQHFQSINWCVCVCALQNELYFRCWYVNFFQLNTELRTQTNNLIHYVHLWIVFSISISITGIYSYHHSSSSSSSFICSFCLVFLRFVKKKPIKLFSLNQIYILRISAHSTKCRCESLSLTWGNARFVESHEWASSLSSRFQIYN